MTIADFNIISDIIVEFIANIVTIPVVTSVILSIIVISVFKCLFGLFDKNK